VAASPSGSTRATRISCYPPEHERRSPSAYFSMARLRARQPASTSRRMEPACSWTAAYTSSCVNMMGPASGRSRSHSTSPAPRRTHSPSGRRSPPDKARLAGIAAESSARPAFATSISAGRGPASLCAGSAQGDREHATGTSMCPALARRSNPASSRAAEQQRRRRRSHCRYRTNSAAPHPRAARPLCSVSGRRGGVSDLDGGEPTAEASAASASRSPLARTRNVAIGMARHRRRAGESFRGEPVVRSPTEAIAGRPRSARRGSTCASSGPCSRPPVRGATAECVANRQPSRRAPRR
jgi:hypothetical protein